MQELARATRQGRSLSSGRRVAVFQGGTQLDLVRADSGMRIVHLSGFTVLHALPYANLRALATDESTVEVPSLIVNSHFLEMHSSESRRYRVADMKVRRRRQYGDCRRR